MLLLLLLLLLQALMLLWKLRNLQLAPSWASQTLLGASVQTAGFYRTGSVMFHVATLLGVDLVSFNGTHPAMQNLHRDVEANSIEFGFSKGYEFCL